MTETAFFIDIETGDLVNPAEIRRLATRNRIENGRNASTMLPRDAKTWSDRQLQRLGYARVYKTDPPQVDDRLKTKDGRHFTWTGERYEQRWEVHDKFSTTRELKDHMLRELDNTAERKRHAGIEVNGIPVRTDPEGIARITGAKLSGRTSRVFPIGEGRSVTLDQADIDGIFEAVDAHIEAVDNRHAKLMDKIENADDPINVDIESGWPV